MSYPEDLDIEGLTDYQKRFWTWFTAMGEAIVSMTDAERAELSAWEAENLDGHTVGTTDWPGWEPRIGLPPWKREDRDG